MGRLIEWARETGPVPPMPYSPEVIAKIKSLPKDSLGAKLGRWAVFLDIPATQIAAVTGATRQSVYNWFKGGEVFVAYRPAVSRLIEVMKTCHTSEEARRNICRTFNLPD